MQNTNVINLGISFLSLYQSFLVKWIKPEFSGLCIPYIVLAKKSLIGYQIATKKVAIFNSKIIIVLETLMKCNFLNFF